MTLFSAPARLPSFCRAGAQLRAAASRLLSTPNYHGNNTFNASEVFGRGIANAISLTYCLSAEQSLGPLMEKYGHAVGRDAFANVIREFWPDINAHVTHRHRPQQ